MAMSLGIYPTCSDKPTWTDHDFKSKTKSKMNGVEITQKYKKNQELKDVKTKRMVWLIKHQTWYGMVWVNQMIFKWSTPQRMILALKNTTWFDLIILVVPWVPHVEAIPIWAVTMSLFDLSTQLLSRQRPWVSWHWHWRLRERSLRSQLHHETSR